MPRNSRRKNPQIWIYELQLDTRNGDLGDAAAAVHVARPPDKAKLVVAQVLQHLVVRDELRKENLGGLLIHDRDLDSRERQHVSPECREGRDDVSTELAADLGRTAV